MSTAPLFRDSLLAAKAKLLDGREKIRAQHDAGSPGIQVCARMTALVDEVLLELFEAAAPELWPNSTEVLRSQVALVAHGGYGRRDVAPYSDVDLMILHTAGAEKLVEPLAKRFMRDLFDVGLDLAQSVRTPEQACELARSDATICTALVESRYLAGSVKLYNHFTQKFQRQTQSQFRPLFRAIEKSRREERSQYGETVYLLEPNVKRSRGGLREIQLLRWIGFARYGISEPDNLQLLGALSKEDQRTLRSASEYLLRLRNEMHFHAGKSADVLDKAEQLRLAKLYGYQGTEGILPVEQFMREYFRQTNAVRGVVGGFLARHQPGSAWQSLFSSLFSHQVDRDYRVSNRDIAANRAALVRLRHDLNEVLRLTDLANLYNKRIADATWEAVRTAADNFSDEITPEISRRFLSLLSQPPRLGELLRRLHELGMLEKIIPQFTHARCLLQFNEYHKYTVDEHCLLSVQRATELFADQGLLGRVYRGIKQKRTLHLALLIHDLGKGFVEDHSEVGRRVAADVAMRLKLPVREAETLKFLVHKHLVMAHLAFRRDTSDPQLIVRFAVEVGSPDVLDMLLVLTVSDFMSVGPGVWNDWKGEVLAELYRRTMQHLAGDAPTSVTEERNSQRKAKVRALLAKQKDLEWYDRQIDALPSAYLNGASPERIAGELSDLHSLQPGEVHAAGHYLPERRAVEYIVGTREDITPGIFHRLTGAIASQRLQILGAEINTLADGLVLDRFYVHDPDHPDEPPAQRLEEVSEALEKSLKSSKPPAFTRVWRSGRTRDRALLANLPTQVRTDNSTSDRYTILDIFANDRLGLLYTIARTLSELGLSVALAKIGTYLDQVVDVFYVTDADGRKIEDEQRLQQISDQLVQAIDAMALD